MIRKMPTPRSATTPKGEMEEEKVEEEDKLDMIIGYLRQMNRRDRWRTIGGFFKSLITLAPVILLLVSAWYFYAHGNELIQQIIQQITGQIAGLTGMGQDTVMKELEKSGVLEQLQGFLR